MDLKKVLELHRLWLYSGEGGVRADLRDADLSGADLSDANLSGADLSDANLSDADLRGANLSGADLRGADLRGADLRDADLSDANLRDADLSDANLSDANQRGANLSGANLSGADLRGADLRGADLRDADLPALTMVLLANWGCVSDDLCVALMRLDASAHDDPEMFKVWATGGNCPYIGRKFQRIVNFREQRDLYTSGPAPTIYEAAARLLSEKTKGWNPK